VETLELHDIGALARVIWTPPARLESRRFHHERACHSAPPVRGAKALSALCVIFFCEQASVSFVVYEFVWDCAWRVEALYLC
jgi:hypothetical protein